MIYLKMIENDFFREKSNFIDFLLAQARAHGCDDVQNKFYDHCTVGFHFESLSLEES